MHQKSIYSIRNLLKKFILKNIKFMSYCISSINHCTSNTPLDKLNKLNEYKFKHTIKSKNTPKKQIMHVHISELWQNFDGLDVCYKHLEMKQTFYLSCSIFCNECNFLKCTVSNLAFNQHCFLTLFLINRVLPITLNFPKTEFINCRYL